MRSMAEKFIGQSLPRVDAYAKVTGRAGYPSDFFMDGMVYMKMLFTGRPHARIVTIDTDRARAVPGVLAVLTAEDVPVNSYGMANSDQPVLCQDVVRFAGDRVALVVDNRGKYPADLMKVGAVTITGRAQQLDPGPKFDQSARLLTARHPYLKSFIESPSTALFRVSAVRFLHVTRFQEVRQWIPASDG